MGGWFIRGRCAYLPRVFPLVPALSADVVVLGFTPPQKETQKEKEKGAWRWVTSRRAHVPATHKGWRSPVKMEVGWGGVGGWVACRGGKCVGVTEMEKRKRRKGMRV